MTEAAPADRGNFRFGRFPVALPFEKSREKFVVRSCFAHQGPLIQSDYSRKRESGPRTALALFCSSGHGHPDAIMTIDDGQAGTRIDRLSSANDLLQARLQGRISRRQLLRRAAALGLAAPVIGVLLHATSDAAFGALR